MRMLSRDNEMFHRLLRKNADFLVAAGLRYECYMIASTKKRNQWQIERLDDLLHCRACREQWFVVMLRMDCEIEEQLVAAGL